MTHASQQSKKSMKKGLPTRASQTPPVSTPRTATRATAQKSVQGICTICKQRQAKFTCLKCGHVVCSSCYYNLIGICKECIAKDIADKWDGKPPTLKKEQNGDWIYD
jgi:hypothetical protein